MTKQVQFSMNLQLFAENDIPADETIQEEETIEDTKEKKFTRTDIAKMIASEKSKWEKESKAEIEQRIEEEKNEAARLAKLSEEERQQALIQKEKDAFDKEKADFHKKQLLVEKGNQLQEIGISSTLAARIQGDTAEDVMEDVKVFKAEWDKALELAVNERLKSSVDNPLGSSATHSEINPFSKDTLNLTEQGRLLKEEPERAKLLQGLANK